MRWDNLKSERAASERLPGLEETVQVRTFDAPEALGIRFHEVEARSAINSVPPQSRVGFRYTINPYRGCTHACVYCLAGETRILMADGRTRELAALKAGDEIYGTRRVGRYRRYVRTTVEAHWQTRKPAFRITLANGTELVASGDHRFLTDRGWKYTTGAGQGSARRPHLTLNNRLLGYGEAPAPPPHAPDYQRGYLCGMLRGDGHIGSYTYRRPRGDGAQVHRFRLALADDEALARSQRFLLAAGVATHEFVFSPATERHRRVKAIRTSRRGDVERCQEMVKWPARAPSGAWTRGFLAGTFDAEGSCSRGILRISNSDPELIGWVARSLQALGLTYRLEHLRHRPGLKDLTAVRLLGGLAARMRLFAEVDPAISRKLAFEGLAVKNRSELRVEAIEPMPEQTLFDITTGTGDFLANGVISHNCFARPTHTYLDMNAREDFEREIVVKTNLPEVLRAELRRPSWKGELVALGTNTDPYQWVEGRYRLTRALWEELLAARNPCSVLTKSPLLLRDLDLFRELDRVTEFGAALSIPTLDEKAWRASEPHTPHPRKRIEAVAELTAAGISTAVLVAPLMPGINDDPEQVEEILRLCGEAGATSISGIGLHLRREVRQIFFDWLADYRPDLLDHYRELYRGGAYLKADERKRIAALVRRSRLQSVARERPRSAGASTRNKRRPADAPAAEIAGPREQVSEDEGIAPRLF